MNLGPQYLLTAVLSYKRLLLKNISSDILLIICRNILNLLRNYYAQNRGEKEASKETKTPKQFTSKVEKYSL